MKKIISIIAIVAFFGAISAPAFASDNMKPVVTAVADEEPKKETTKKSEKKSSDCATKAEAKKACGEKKEKSCGDKDKK